MAAESGQKEGMFRVSLAYFLGKGCEKEESIAYRWLKKAAAKGHEEAKKMLKEKAR